jgi:hypothetical protein
MTEGHRSTRNLLATESCPPVFCHFRALEGGHALVSSTVKRIDVGRETLRKEWQNLRTSPRNHHRNPESCQPLYSSISHNPRNLKAKLLVSTSWHNLRNLVAKAAFTRGVHPPTYSTKYAYGVGYRGGDRSIRPGAYRLCAQRRHSCAAVKLWEDDKICEKVLPQLVTFLLFLFGAGACAFGRLKRFNELLYSVRWPRFLQEAAVCFVLRGCTSQYCTYFLHMDASHGCLNGHHS